MTKPQSRIFPALLAMLGFALVTAQRPAGAGSTQFRPPAVPLVAHDPYFSVWSTRDRLGEDWSRHWTGAVHAMCGMARIDGKPFRFMGAAPQAVPEMSQTDLQVLPTRTLYRFEAGGIRLGVTFTTPTLPHDLDLLSLHFIAHYAREHGRPVRAVAEEVFNVLHRHPWPGNVRQLRNAAERAVVMADGEVLLPQHLPADILAPPETAQANGTQGPSEPPLVTLEEMEKRMIRRALRETANNVTVAAERLGIHRNTLRRKITDYGIEQS